MSVLDIAMSVADVVAARPSPAPSHDQLSRCKLIAHRGECHQGKLPENTLASLQAAVDSGVWGLECDIRWTRDLVPVICHDPTTERVFGVELTVADCTFAQLREAVPALPRLAEVIEQFGGRRHLMLELKSEHWQRADRQAAILRDELHRLEPVEDYHLLSLDTAMFERVVFAPPRSWLPVAELNVRQMSRFAEAHACAGVAGHFLLMNQALHTRHTALGQIIGVGFPASENCLRRQLRRGIEWVFTNHSARLAAALHGMRRDASVS